MTIQPKNLLMSYHEDQALREVVLWEIENSGGGDEGGVIERLGEWFALHGLPGNMHRETVKSLSLLFRDLAERREKVGSTKALTMLMAALEKVGARNPRAMQKLFDDLNEDQNYHEALALMA